MNDNPAFPTEADLHAYVDGRLDEAAHARMEAWLERHPQRAHELRGWQRDAQRLRAALGAPPVSTIPARLDPAVLRARRHRRRQQRLGWAAMLLLAFGAGGGAGWQARRVAMETPAAPMADALQAYRMFAHDRQLRLDVVQHHAGDLQAWLQQHFRHASQLPDLHDAGFDPVGGRLLATDAGPAAMVLYRDAAGNAISFYVRPPSPHAGSLPRGQRRDGPLVAAYWSGQGYNYALVARDDATDLRAIHDAWGASAI